MIKNYKILQYSINLDKYYYFIFGLHGEKLLLYFTIFIKDLMKIIQLFFIFYYLKFFFFSKKIYYYNVFI